MANEDHVKILASGHLRWNKWRNENNNINPDLSDLDLSDAGLEKFEFFGTDFSRGNLRSTSFHSVDLRRSVFADADLQNAVFHAADLSEANLYGANLSGANFGAANLSRCDLRETAIERANFKQAAVTDRTLGLDRLSLSSQVSLVRPSQEVNLGGATEASEALPVDPVLSSKAEAEQSITQSRSDLTELLQKLDSFIPEEEDADGENRTPIPLTRKQYEMAVAAVEATIAFHKVETTDSWDDRVRGIIKSLNEILKDLEVMGRQFGKTISAWVPIAGLLRRVIRALDVMLEAPKGRDKEDDE